MIHLKRMIDFSLMLKVKMLDRVVIDHVHKAVYVVVPKAGSISMKHFLARSIGEHIPVTTNVEYYQKLGLNNTRNVTVKEFREIQKDYFTYVVVRHPLQRYVSGYFQTHARKYSNKHHCPPPCDPNDAFRNFTLAASRGKALENFHWTSHQLSAKPCDIRIDMILKVETMDEDSVYLQQRLEMGDDTTLKHNHVTDMKNPIAPGTIQKKISSILTKYDKMLKALRDNEPRLFRWLFDYVSLDMQMFGYSWDAKTSSSKCGHKTEAEKVCC